MHGTLLSTSSENTFLEPKTVDFSAFKIDKSCALIKINRRDRAVFAPPGLCESWWFVQIRSDSYSLKDAGFVLLRDIVTQPDKVLYQRIQACSEYKSENLAETFLQALTEDGKNSYEVLVSEVPQQRGGRLVDLASGCGPMAEACLRAMDRGSDIILVDFDAREIELAQKRMSGRPAAFLNEAAQALSIESGSAAVVFCHLGVMFFDPLEPALKEIGRILAPAGRFVFNILAPIDVPLSRQYFDICQKYEALVPDFRGWGDVRASSKEALTSLFSGLDGMSAPRFEAYRVWLSGSPESLLSTLKSFYQVSYLLPAKHRETLCTELLGLLRANRKGEENLRIELAFFKGVVEKRL